MERQLKTGNGRTADKIESFDCGVAPLETDEYTELRDVAPRRIRPSIEHCDYCHATLDPSEVVWYNDLPYCTGCYYDRPDPYDEAVDRQAEVRDVQSDMSSLGKLLFETAQDITCVYLAGMKAGQA